MQLHVNCKTGKERASLVIDILRIIPLLHDEESIIVRENSIPKKD